jgi:two-component system response regulator YesN
MNSKTKKVYIKSLFSYFLILIFSIALVLLVFDRAVKILKRQAFELSLASLEQGKNMLEKRLDDIKNMSIQLSLNDNVLKLLNTSNTPNANGIPVIDVMLAQSAIVPYKITNNFINSFFIYIIKPKLVLSSFTSSFNEKYFYDRAFRYGNMSYEQWYGKITETKFSGNILPSNQVVINNQKKQVITYLQSIPIDGTGTPKGVIVVFIDENEILNVFKPLISQKCEWIYLFNNDGEVITSFSNEIKEVLMRFGKV